MGWLFEKLVEIVGGVISFLIAYIAASVTNLYSLKGSDTLHYFFGVFSGSASKAGTADAGPFGSAYRLFLYTGLAIIFFGMLYNLIKAFFGPLAQAEPPTKTILKAIFFATLCGFSQGIVALIIDITQIPFDAIAGPLDNFGPADIVAHMGWNSQTNFLDWSVTDVALSLVNNGAWIMFSPKVWQAVVGIILFMMLFKNMLMLVLEMAERYLMIGILTIIAPLCIACGAVKTVEDVFKNWLSWMINACVVLIFNTFFICIFVFNFSAHVDIPYLCLWIAWVKAGQKIDEHMNALGLKTAKTGGFGADVMGALLTGLPMALGAADKFAGTNMAGVHQWAKRGMQGPMPQLSKTDARTGEKSSNIVQKAAKGLLNAAGNAASKATGIEGLKDFGTKASDLNHKSAEKMAIGLSKAKTAAGNMLPGKDETVGSRRGFTGTEMNEMLSGKKEMPAKGTPQFNETMKDMMDMKGGKELTDKLEKQGYNITGMSQDANGNVSFSAEDANGNKIVGNLTEGEAGRNSGLVPVAGEDGQQRGLALTQSQVEGAENPLNIGGVGDQPNADMAVAALNAEAMQQNGSVTGGGEQVSVDGNTYTLGEPDENGVRIGTNVDDPNDTKAFEANENGGFTALSNGEQVDVADSSVIGANGESMQITGKDADGNITAQDASGNTHTFREDGNGGLQELADAKVEGNASFQVDGQTFTGTLPESGAGVFTAKDENGQERSFGMSKDGSICSLQETTDESGAKSYRQGDTVAEASDVNRSTTASAGGESYNLTKNADGSYTGITAAGKTARFEDTPDGLKMVQDSSAKQAISVSDGKGNTQTAFSTGNGTYASRGSDGSQSYFAKGSDGNYYRTGSTDANGNYTSARSASSSPVEYLGESGVTVKTADGNFVHTENQHRYDQYGKQNANGDYMRTTGSDGSSNLVRVATNSNGSISTYEMDQSMNTTMFESKDASGNSVYQSFEQYSRDPANSGNISHQFEAADPSSPTRAATHIINGNNVWAYSEGAVPTASGQMLPQRYIRTKDGVEQPLDMSKCQFDSNGYLLPGTDVYVQGSSRPVDFSQDGYTMGRRNGQGGTMPSQYTHAVNTANGKQDSLEVHKGQECYAAQSYVNGIPTNLDWNSATYRGGETCGFSDSEMVVSFGDGTKVRLMPETARTEGLQGSYVNLPFNIPGSNGAGGQRVFMAAMPESRMESAMRNYFSHEGKDYSNISQPIDITDRSSAGFKVLANEFGIPTDTSVKNIKFSPTSSGPVLQYSQMVDGRLRHFAVSASGFESKTPATPIYSGASTNIVGYRQEIAQGEPFVAKISRKNPMRRYHRKNEFPEESRRR